MNGYQRIKAAFAGEKTDRVPMMLHNFMPAAREYGITMRQYRESGVNIADSHIAMAQKYELDGMWNDIDTCILADVIGVPIDYPEDMPARVTGHIPGGIDGAIDAMDPDKVAKNERVKISAESIYQLRKKIGNELFIRASCDQMAFSLSALAVGMEELMVNLKNPALEEKLMTLLDRATDVHLEFHKILYQAGADCTSFGDSSCGPDLISPKMYQKFAKPFHVKLSKALKTLQIPVVCHICGNLDKIMEDVAEVGFDGIEFDYKSDVQKARDTFYGRALSFGPIDPSGVFCLGTPQMVRSETQRVLDVYGGKGIVIGAGCALPPDTPEENIRAFTETVKAYAIDWRQP